MKAPSFVAVFAMLAIGCQSSEESSPDPIPQETPFGYYVSDGYAERDQGYDWVSVELREGDEGCLKLRVRSRADQKRPTCTWDATFYPQDDKTYLARENGYSVRLSLFGDSLQIQGADSTANVGLHFFCSGGATVAGTYYKWSEPIDESQIDLTAFSRVLRLQDVGFHVSSRKVDDRTQLVVIPFGLEQVNTPDTTRFYGSVVEAEVEDMNSDGSPELLIYAVADGSGSYGDVVAYSVNNGKSMSRVNFPPLDQEEAAYSEGYMGHDEFALVERTLVRRFPIYLNGDSNANPTGGTRQLEYRLEEGEAMRQLVLFRSTDFPKKEE